LSERLHLGGRTSRNASSTSVNIPVQLPEIERTNVAVAGKGDEDEAEWEKRATLLAKSNPNLADSSTGNRAGSSRVSGADGSGDVRFSNVPRIGCLDWKITSGTSDLIRCFCAG